MDILAQNPLTLALQKAGVVAGTTTTLTITTATPFALKGKAFVVAAAANGAVPIVDDITAAAFVPVTPGTGAAFVIAVDAAGVLRVTQSALWALDPALTSGAALFITGPQMPAVKDTRCPLAYLVVKVGSAGAAWTFGVSNMAGPPANTSLTFVDVVTLPERPQVA